jgi:hypothetical protein
MAGTQSARRYVLLLAFNLGNDADKFTILECLNGNNRRLTIRSNLVAWSAPPPQKWSFCVPNLPLILRWIGWTFTSHLRSAFLTSFAVNMGPKSTMWISSAGMYLGQQVVYLDAVSIPPSQTHPKEILGSSPRLASSRTSIYQRPIFRGHPSGFRCRPSRNRLPFCTLERGARVVHRSAEGGAGAGAGVVRGGSPLETYGPRQAGDDHGDCQGRNHARLAVHLASRNPSCIMCDLPYISAPLTRCESWRSKISPSEARAGKPGLTLGWVLACFFFLLRVTKNSVWPFQKVSDSNSAAISSSMRKVIGDAQIATWGGGGGVWLWRSGIWEPSGTPRDDLSKLFDA